MMSTEIKEKLQREQPAKRRKLPVTKALETEGSGGRGVASMVMSTGRSGVKEQELTDMEEDDIKQFIIDMDKKNPDEYKAQAEVLYQEGVTGKALLSYFEEGKKEFVPWIQEYTRDHIFAVTFHQALKEKLQREQPAKRRKLPVTKAMETEGSGGSGNTLRACRFPCAPARSSCFCAILMGEK
mmetsp:Transcript_1310/g.2242  ORF Transcript_1310/g.2242 Transcript_1310/m.2242 type:complete len:183 (+) Transcript_1310:88-636(+)